MLSSIRLKERKITAKKCQFMPIPVGPIKGGGNKEREKSANQHAWQGSRGQEHSANQDRAGAGLNELSQAVSPGLSEGCPRPTSEECIQESCLRAASGTKIGGSKVLLQAQDYFTDHIFPGAARPQLLCYEKHYHCRVNSFHIHHLLYRPYMVSTASLILSPGWELMLSSGCRFTH